MERNIIGRILFIVGSAYDRGEQMKPIIRTNGLKNHRNDKSELKTIKELEEIKSMVILMFILNI